jgi:NACalpha-BTF3-like transcription factor
LSQAAKQAYDGAGLGGIDAAAAAAAASTAAAPAAGAAASAAAAGSETDEGVQATDIELVMSQTNVRHFDHHRHIKREGASQHGKLLFVIFFLTTLRCARPIL